MKRTIKFKIPGKAVPLQRPRINIGLAKSWRPGKSMGPLVYTPSKCKKWQKFVRHNLFEQYAMVKKFNFPVSVHCIFYIKRPGKISKYALRPDIDNYAKNVLDALDGFLFPDDSWVTMLVAEKKWVDNKNLEFTHVKVKEI